MSTSASARPATKKFFYFSNSSEPATIRIEKFISACRCLGPAEDHFRVADDSHQDAKFNFDALFRNALQHKEHQPRFSYAGRNSQRWTCGGTGRRIRTHGEYEQTVQ